MVSGTDFSWQQGSLEDVLGELTLTEKCAMVAGTDMWTVPGCERLGVPAWSMGDGPVGVRGKGTEPGLVLPSPSAMAATWDTNLVRQLGVFLGQECLDRGMDMLLAPNVNLHRVPGGGRHFEMFSEDPELSARMAVAYIRGVQDQGVGACIKHYVGNEQELNRYTRESRIETRTLREVYLAPFEAAVKEAGVQAVMGAYNYVNGEQACSHEELLSTILKDEWGFEGIVLSDWGALKETVGPALRGCDIEMPGPGRWWGAGRLEAATQAGQVPEPVLDDKVRRVLRFLAWRHRRPAGADPVGRPEARRLARRVAADGMVLLKNDGLLPLPAGATVALIGAGAKQTALSGGGSAALTAESHRSVLDAFTSRWPNDVLHAEGVLLDRSAPALVPSWLEGQAVRAELFEGCGFEGRPFEVQEKPSVSNRWFGDAYPAHVVQMSVRLTFRLRPEKSGRYRLAVAGYGATRLYVDGELVADNRLDSYGAGPGRRAADGTIELLDDRSYDVILEAEPKAGGVRLLLTELGIERLEEGGAQARLAEAERVARAADVAVVVVGSNDQWESEGEDRATLQLPAGQDELVRRVVRANPRTVVVLNCGGPMLLPWLEQVPAALVAWYPGQEGADALIDVLTGEAEPGGRMPTTWPRREQDTPAFRYPGDEDSVTYGEGTLIGHRWYDAHGIEPLVAFGHGGSYTSFQWEQPLLSGSGTAVVVEVPVRNTGPRDGREVVQVYLAPCSPPVSRPPKVLAGFAKLNIPAGGQATASIHLNARAFGRWDESCRSWVFDPGTYDVIIAASAVDERCRMRYELGG